MLDAHVAGHAVSEVKSGSRGGLAVLVLGLALASPALAAEYYLHPNGNDLELGTSEATAWQTLAHAIPKLSAGDILYLGGDASVPYQGQAEVEIDVTGEPGPGLEIRIRNQPGHSPVVSGTRRFDGGWTLHSGQIYRRDLAAEPVDPFTLDFRPLLLFQNPSGQTGGDFLSNPPDPVASLADLTPGTWFHEVVGGESRLYVWVNDLGAGSDANAYTIELGERTSALGDRNAPFASHLVFEGIEFRGYPGFATNSTGDVLLPGAVTITNAAATLRQDITFSNCTFRQNWKGLRAGAVHDLVIENSLFSENIASGMSIGLNTSANPQTGFVLTNSTIADTYGPWPNKSVADSNPAAVKAHKMAGGSISGVLVDGTHLNRAGDYAPHGLWVDVDVSDFVIENNVVRDVRGFAGSFSGRGIFVERRADRVAVQRNLIVNAQHGIVLGSKGQPTGDWPEETQVRNNTIVDSVYNGVYVIAAVLPDIFNNIIVGSNQTPIRIDAAALDYHVLNGGAVHVEANESWDAAPPGPGLYYGTRTSWNTPANKTASEARFEPGLNGFRFEVNAEPSFVDAPNGDYALAAGAPAVDAGLPTGEPFNGYGVDLGYLESSHEGVPLPLLGGPIRLLLVSCVACVGFVQLLRARHGRRRRP